MSRMDRYYNNNINKRTNRNQELYKTIYDDTEYSNIEGIATIDKANEIDITKIKNMLKNREEYPSNRELRSYDEKKLETPKYETFERDDDRVYDIRDILSKAKSNKEEEKYHNLDQKNIEILRELKQKTKETHEPDLTGMIDTITNTSKLNKLTDNELGLDMFEDLKSNDNTVIDGKDSIKSILEEAKKQEPKEIEKTNTSLDKSFFTSSLSFNDSDFEQITELNKNVKKNNLMIKILFFIILIAATIGAIILVFNFLK